MLRSNISNIERICRVGKIHIPTGERNSFASYQKEKNKRWGNRGQDFVLL